MTHGTNTACRCGLTYDALRTGLTFREVASWLWVGNPDRTTWRQKTRHTVLGRWREHKLELWTDHVNTCQDLVEEPIEASNTVDQADGASGESNTAGLLWRALPWVAAGTALATVLS